MDYHKKITDNIDDIYVEEGDIVSFFDKDGKFCTKDSSGNIVVIQDKINQLDEKIEDFKEEQQEVEETKIVKRKKVDVKPMSEEEAVLQMELLGHDFYLFKDADTMKPTLVYKRKDNQYGIIETE